MRLGNRGPECLLRGERRRDLIGISPRILEVNPLRDGAFPMILRSYFVGAKRLDLASISGASRAMTGNLKGHQHAETEIFVSFWIDMFFDELVNVNCKFFIQFLNGLA